MDQPATKSSTTPPVLGEIFQTHLQAGENGLLLIKLEDQNHLCKIAIEDGRAVHISLGPHIGDAALSVLDQHTPEWTSFIDDVPARKRLKSPINKQLMGSTEHSGASPNTAATPHQKVTETQTTVDLSNGANAEIIDMIIEDFVDRIGPLGNILAERAALDLGYREGAQMTPATLQSFITVLAQEIPKKERNSFLKKYAPSPQNGAMS
ncbi:MAG: hypothetical protein C0618_02460 [Desulfuromonas sp.]|nr:MAG: hypothetical protein C0618_02460 [Desulfuromonas sp.]